MMKKTLAESIRDVLNIISEAPAHMADALHDLHNESGGNPTLELAQDIAADYPGVTAERLMAEYPTWAETQSNKAPVEPAKDPKKAAMAQRYQASQDETARRKEIEAERERRKQELEDNKRKHKEDHADFYAAAEAELDKFKHLPGWKVTEGDADAWGDNSDKFTISNDDGIRIVMWAEVHSASGHYAGGWEVCGDVKFTANGKEFTFTRRGIDSYSFSVPADKLEDPATVIQQQVEKVEASRARLEGQVEVPGTHGIRVSKDEIAQIADTIRKGGKYTLTPAGMGIGYELSAKPRQWARPAPEEMKKFFGLDRLYIFQLDFD